MRRKAINALATAATPEQYDSLAERLSTVPIAELSNELFQNIINKLPGEQCDAWIEKLPGDRAEWARANIK